ncbi:alpha/beta fold hydrolase [Ekhidna sp. To15]|uniref:alpha/beta fold hydrolase n=1 Tax=Ekhidna sp. To15 TaxID=3395267 RepID=UPI003F5259DE
MEHYSLEDWYKSTTTFSWKEHQVIYKIHESEKPWLLLIHGFPTASYDWHKIWHQLTERFSLVALDMLGFGYSDKPNPFPYSIMQQADLMQDLIQHLKISDCHLLAHDYGDTVAQELIARHNEGGSVNLISACLLNGGIFPESHHPLPIQKMLMSPIGFILSKLLNQKKFEKSFGRIFGPDTSLAKEELNTYWQLVSKHNGHRIAHLIIRYMRERVQHRERWVGALQNFKQPLGLINGLVDPISGQVMVDRYREIITVENIWTMDRIGHYPQVEAPEEVMKFYREFLKYLK